MLTALRKSPQLHSYLPSSSMPGRHLNLSGPSLAWGQAERQGPWASCFFFSFSLTWDPMGANLQNSTPPWNCFSIFFKLLDFLLIGLHKCTVLELLNFEITIFHNFFFLFVTMWPYLTNNSKRYSSLKSCLIFFFKTSLEFFFSQQVLFWVSEFLIHFFRKFHFHHCHIGKQKTAIISKRSHRRAKQSEIWASGGRYSVYTGYLWQLSDQGQSEVIRWISNLRQPCMPQTAGCRAKRKKS